MSIFLMNARPTHSLFLLFTILLSACAPVMEPGVSISSPPAPVTSIISELPSVSPPTLDGEITSVSNSEIRFLAVHADLATAAQIDIPLLGDGLEVAGITLVETRPEPRIVATISIPEPDVIEGIYPIWANMNEDGKWKIIVTLSNAQTGARIVAFREDGSPLPEGPPIGAGSRWRHQLVAAPFGGAGENLLAVVQMPHIGGVLEFYRLNRNKFEIVTETHGFSTHTIGLRNLFTVQADDFDKDGQVGLLAPDQGQTRLGIVNMDGTVTWLELNAELVTNLASVTSPNSDNFVLAAGLSNHTLRLWLP